MVEHEQRAAILGEVHARPFFLAVPPRALLQDGGTPRTPDELAGHLAGMGWHVEPQESPAGSPRRLDVVVGSLT